MNKNDLSNVCIRRKEEEFKYFRLEFIHSSSTPVNVQVD